MQYFEVHNLYDTVPTWVVSALGLGDRLRASCSKSRRIVLLSMPCESHVGGLVALGALRRDLGSTEANHLDTHFDLLLRVCRERTSIGTFDENATFAPEWDVRNSSDNSLWRFTAYDDLADAIVVEDARHRPVVKFKGKKIPNPNGACSRYITRSNSGDWQLHDCPIPKVPPGGEALDRSDYIDLPGCSGAILDENLRQSYEGLVLVGQGAARDSKYMQRLYTVGFHADGRALPLGDLLTVHNREQKRICRLRFINERSHQGGVSPEASLVVADGISAFLYAVEHFPVSDIVGVCNRDAPVAATLQLKERLDSMIRYYADIDSRDVFPDKMPTGMLLRVLQRRG